MKIVEINSVCGIGSTGRICVGIAEVARAQGHECTIAYGRAIAPQQYEGISYRIGNDLGVRVHALKSRLFGKTSTYSKAATKKLIAWLEEYKPDVLHLHNLHGYYLNVPMLFAYIKRNHVRVIWTLHDCWAFTGHCAYFDRAGCDKWKDGCKQCPQKSSYPKSLVDRSKQMYRLKKELFTGVEDMTIVTPSRWLADLAKQSFLGEYAVEIVHNGIDLDVFRPTQSVFRDAHCCEDKFVLLGVSLDWDARKGLDVFRTLGSRLPDRYKIVLVGVNEALKETLPDKIVTIPKTQSVQELAEIYTAADLFVNPTREENFPTVNIEALACGTPVLTFNTGGSPEIIDETCGEVVAKDDIDGLVKQIERIDTEKPFTQEACLARAAHFEATDKFKQYIEIYKK